MSVGKMYGRATSCAGQGGAHTRSVGGGGGRDSTGRVMALLEWLLILLSAIGG